MRRPKGLSSYVILLGLLLAVTGASAQLEEASCKEDAECPVAEFCDASEACVPCPRCVEFSREDGDDGTVACVKGDLDCGPCLDGYHEHDGYCVDVPVSAVEDIVDAVDAANVFMIASICVLGTVLLLAVAFFIYRRRCRR